MVQKSIPSSATSSAASVPDSTNTSSPYNVAPPAGGGFSHPGGNAAGAQPGANVFIRSVQFGFDPHAANSSPISNSGAPGGTSAPSGAQPMGSVPPGQSTSGTPPNGAAPIFNGDMFRQIFTTATQAASAFLAPMTQQQQATAQASASTTPDANTPGSQQAAGTSSQTSAGQAAPQHAHPNLTQVRINVSPAISPNLMVHHHLDPLETSIIPQFEAHIKRLAQDISEGQMSFNPTPYLPDRTYDITPPAATPLQTLMTPENQNVDEAVQYSPQSLWKRVKTLQRRWMHIIDAIEGPMVSFGTSTDQLDPSVANLTGPLIASSATSSNDVPMLILPPLHPLRHLLEHWIPIVSSQMANILHMFAPILSRQHHIVHHQYNHQAPNRANVAPSTSSNTTQTENNSSAVPQTSTAQRGNESAVNRASNPPSSTNRSDSDDELELAADELMRSLIAESPSQAASNTSSNTSSNDSSSHPIISSSSSSTEAKNTQSIPEQKSSSESSISTTPSTSDLTNDQLWAQWKATIDADVAKQKKNSQPPQRPFSAAYDPESQSFSAENASNASSRFLQTLLTESESSLPGSAGETLALSSAPVPPALLQSFQDRLVRFIQTRLEGDEDWNALGNQREARYPNLSQISRSNPSQSNKNDKKDNFSDLD